MKQYSIERCTNPRDHYRTAQEVLDDDELTSSEKELVLKTMAAHAELLDDFEKDEPPTVGDHPPTIWEIHAALSELGEPHGFPGPDKKRERECASIERVVAAISGHSDVDVEVCEAAKRLADITKEHVLFVSVIPRVTDPAKYSALAPFGAAAAAPDVGARRLDDERERRKKTLAEFGRHGALPDDYSTEIRIGLVGDEIINAANESNASLIIVGSSEKAWLERILSANIARELLSKSDRPLLIVPEKSEARP